MGPIFSLSYCFLDIYVNNLKNCVCVSACHFLLRSARRLFWRECWRSCGNWWWTRWKKLLCFQHLLTRRCVRKNDIHHLIQLFLLVCFWVLVLFIAVFHCDCTLTRLSCHYPIFSADLLSLGYCKYVCVFVCSLSKHEETLFLPGALTRSSAAFVTVFYNSSSSLWIKWQHGVQEMTPAYESLQYRLTVHADHLNLLSVLRCMIFFYVKENFTKFPHWSTLWQYENQNSPLTLRITCWCLKDHSLSTAFTVVSVSLYQGTQMIFNAAKELGQLSKLKVMKIKGCNSAEYLTIACRLNISCVLSAAVVSTDASVSSVL